MMVRDKPHNCLKLCIFGTNTLPWRFIRWWCCWAQFNPDIIIAIKPRINTLTKISGSQWALLDNQTGKCLQSGPWTPTLKAMEHLNPGVTPAATPDSSAVSVWVIRMHRAEEWVLNEPVIVLLYDVCADVAWMWAVSWLLKGRISTKTCHCCQVKESAFGLRIINIQRF